MENNFSNIFTLLEAVEEWEDYQQKFADPKVFFAANYQKNFNERIDILLIIEEELKKLGTDLSLKKENFFH